MKNSIITECWKPVVGFEGKYEVSDLGNVRSLNYHQEGKVKILKPQDNGKGYLVVQLCKNGKVKNFYVHVLTITTFQGPIPQGMTVDHINGNKRDNRLSNLQLLTHADNVRKAANKQLDLTLAEHPFTKLTFPSSAKAGEFFGYQRNDMVATYIYRARKRGDNFINIRGKQYLFTQYQNEEDEALNKFSEQTHN